MSAIQEFYKGRTIFVTGGTGFMGKVFLEKVVRSLPDIKRVYVLIRAKKGMTPEERVTKLITSLPFTLNNIPQENLEKIVPVTGDITKKDFAFVAEDRQKLLEEVSVVFHLAAVVRMNMPLKEAVIDNVLPVVHLFNFCTEIKNLVAVCHLSTAYCNVEQIFMEEKVYPMKVNPYALIQMVQWMDDKALKTLEKEILPPHPNTYTFTKRLGEIIAADRGKTLPICILRPSIVLPALYEPDAGWVDTFNGPMGLFIAAGKGVVRTGLVDRELTPQIIPVDIAINGIIIAGYDRANSEYDETPVFNMTQAEKYIYSWGKALDFFRSLVAKYPFKKMLWLPGGDFTNSYRVNLVKMILFQFIPALVVDFLMIIFLQKPFLLNVQWRIYDASKLLQYFVLRDWKFSHEKTLALVHNLNEEDNKIFYTDVEVNPEDYLVSAFFGSKKYCVKEDLDNIEYYRLQYKAFFVLDLVVKLALGYYLLKFIIFLLQATIFT